MLYVSVSLAICAVTKEIMKRLSPIIGEYFHLDKVMIRLIIHAIGTSLFDIASMLSKQEKYNESIDFYERSMAMFKQCHPINHIKIMD